MKAGNVPTGMQMNLLFLFLRPTGTRRAHVLFPIQLLTSPIHFSLIYFTSSMSGRFGKTEEKRQNAYFILFSIFQDGSYPCIVPIVHWLFMESGVHGFCFTLSRGNQISPCLFNLYLHMYASLWMTFHCKAVFYDPAS